MSYFCIGEGGLEGLKTCHKIAKVFYSKAHCILKILPATKCWKSRETLLGPVYLRNYLLDSFIKKGIDVNNIHGYIIITDKLLQKKI